jgi:orotate phosphoribosyltransferase
MTSPGTAALAELVRTRGYTRADEPFRLSSGGESYDYVDMRRAVARGADLRYAADAVIAHLDAQGVVYVGIGGMTMGADPVAHAVAVVSGRSWFSVRKAEKDHGARQRVEGMDVESGTPVVVFEDTVSTGRSLLEALDVVTEAGAHVVAACTLLDRGDSARPLVEARGIPYFALLVYTDVGIESLDAPSSGVPST